jgi:hypothetical protein
MGYTEEIVKKKIEAIAKQRHQKKVIRKRVKTSSQKLELKNKNNLKKIESILDDDKLSATKKLELVINQF